jgi:hypothetical protein
LAIQSNLRALGHRARDGCLTQQLYLVRVFVATEYSLPASNYIRAS